MALGEYEGALDTTADTTQSATRSNGAQLLARGLAQISWICNMGQLVATYVGGLWLRRSQVRAPSVTLLYSA